MELFLWRHADALPGTPDIARELSPLGNEQARKVAAWLKARAPEALRLLVSPAARTRQTVAWFHDDETDIQFCPPLYDSISPDEILSILGWPGMPLSTLVVGHQPLIGALGVHLLMGAAHPETFNKSALWRLRIEPGQARAQFVEAVDGDMLA